MHGSTSPSTVIARLAARAKLSIGTLVIEPAARTLAGPLATTTVEPRVMQVLFALVDAGGAVVSRTALLEKCWQGVFVGDDALNRAIFEVRRALRVAGADFAVETISRTGYRLTGLPAVDVDPTDAPGPSLLPTSAGAPAAADVRAPSRRKIVGGLTSVILACGAGFAWRADRSPNERSAAALVERGDIVRRDDMPDAAEQGVAFYREALKLTPDDAAILGKLALALGAVAEYAGPAKTAAAVAGAQQAAGRALRLQPGQADATVALTTLAPVFGSWLRVERLLRQVLAATPDNIAARSALAMLLVEVGRIGDASRIIDQLVEREPLSPSFNYRQVYLLWARGRRRDADRVADRALQLWPRHPAVWLARLWTFALTSRPAAALTMVNDVDDGPTLPLPMRQLLRATLTAIKTRASADVAAASALNQGAARHGQFGVVNGALTLPALGEVDAAFAILRGYLVREGPLVGMLRRPKGEPAINQQNRRKTMMLWMPATAPLRADRRFWTLCQDIGLSGYWQASGSEPDCRRQRG